jgi:hypothetical protein
MTTSRWAPFSVTRASRSCSRSDASSAVSLTSSQGTASNAVCRSRRAPAVTDRTRSIARPRVIIMTHATTLLLAGS